MVVAVNAGCEGSSETADAGDQDAQDNSTAMFFDLRVEDVEARRAVLRFVTAVETTCEAQLGSTAETLDRIFLDPFMDPADPYDINHEVPLVQLEPETTYFVAARAEDRSGTVFLSEVLSFQTTSEADSEGASNMAALQQGTSVLAVSSNFGDAGNSETWGIDNALDGDLRTEWSSFQDGDDAWFEIDLGASRTIERIGFQSRQMTNGTSIIESFQLTIDDGTVLGPFSSPDPDTYYDFILDAPFTTRVVRFDAVQTTGGNTGIKELELYGE